MVSHADAGGLFSSEREVDPGSVLIRLAPYTVVECRFTLELAEWLWTEMNKYRTLWSDYARGDMDVWYDTISDGDSFWLLVLKDGRPVGTVRFAGMGAVTDVEAHVMFFDRVLTDKVELAQMVARWFFLEFPGCHRLTAIVPAIYHSTVRMAKRVGFREEGRKRESLLIGGRRVDEMLFGLLASEML